MIVKLIGVAQGAHLLGYEILVCGAMIFNHIMVKNNVENIIVIQD